MIVSVCTAVHPPAAKYLPDLYTSLLRQTYDKWEWVIATNGGATVPNELRQDERVNVVNVDGGQAVAKAAACRESSGQWIVRVDADDILMPRALGLIAFSPGQFAYSNWALFEDKTWTPKWYNKSHGWRYRDIWIDGRKLYEHLAWPLGPLMVASLYHAPSCLLAWRRKAYFDSGGFDNEPNDSPEHRPVCRTYCQHGAAGMHHIDECLYLYRQRPDSESLGVIPHDAAVAMHTAAYLEMVEPCYRRWIADMRLHSIRLEDRWNQHAVEDGCVGLMHTSRDDLPWDDVFRAMAPGGLVIVDHMTTGDDPRFHRYHQSEAGTHYVALKGEYGARPIDRLPAADAVGVPVPPRAKRFDRGVKIPRDARPLPKMPKTIRALYADVHMGDVPQNGSDQGCGRIDVFSGVGH